MTTNPTPPADLNELVFNFFKDQDKTEIWFKAKNYLLGNVSPNSMIQAGRVDHLRKFILNQLDENTPPASCECICLACGLRFKAAYSMASSCGCNKPAADNLNNELKGDNNV